MPSPTQANRSPLSWRWVVVLLVSILLHVIALEWANGNLRFPAPGNAHEDVVTTVQLDAPETPSISPEPAVKPRPKQKSPARHAVVPPPPAPAPVSAANDSSADALSAVPAKQAAAAEGPAAAKPSDDTPAQATASNPAETAAAPPANEQQTAEQAPPHYKVDLPPPVEVHYDVSKVEDSGTHYYGRGKIVWQSSGGNYQVDGTASVLFWDLLHFKSEGQLDEYGIAPVLYNQKNFHRPEFNTHFNRDERNSISFSSSKLSIPRKGGEQDRASVMWELAGIGRGDREKFVPDAQIDLFVAGERDGDLWRIQIIGQEEIETGAGKTMAWHVVRKPRAGTYEDQIDIWLAPQYEWSPIKIHYSYKRGGYLDLSMSSFHQLQLADLH